MIAVLILGLGLAWTINRPYPGGGFGSAAFYVVWSDGTLTAEEGPYQYRSRGNSWFCAVDFPDGRTRYYLMLR